MLRLTKPSKALISKGRPKSVSCSIRWRVGRPVGVISLDEEICFLPMRKRSILLPSCQDRSDGSQLLRKSCRHNCCVHDPNSERCPSGIVLLPYRMRLDDASVRNMLAYLFLLSVCATIILRSTYLSALHPLLFFFDGGLQFPVPLRPAVRGYIF